MPRISNITQKPIKQQSTEKQKVNKDTKQSLNAHSKPIQRHRATKSKDTTYYAKGVQTDSVMVYSKAGDNGAEYANEKIAMYNCKSDRLIVYVPSMMHSINYDKLVDIANRMWNEPEYH